MGFIKEFKEFALKGNVLDMAVGVIIGGAFGKIVSSLVDDIIMPIVGKAVGNVDFTSLFINLSGDEKYDSLAAAKEAGADYVGLDEYIDKSKGGWTDIDVIITMPSCMGKIGPLGRVLGPRGLMPNPKSGTVTMDVAKAVKEVKQGKIDFKVDKAGIIHTSIGKVSMTPEQLYGNAKEFIATVIKLKPAAAKGTYIKSIYLSSTMSIGVKVDPKTIE